MNNKEKYTLIVLAGISLSLIAASGVPKQKDSYPLEYQNLHFSASPSASTYVTASSLDKDKIMHADMATTLEEIALDILGVAGASVLIHDKEALVGLRLSNYTRGRNIIQQDVKTALSLRMPGYIIHVTSNRHLYQRIHILRNQLRNGHHIETFERNIRAIIHEMTPPLS